jgi:hypothetical protein
MHKTRDIPLPCKREKKILQKVIKKMSKKNLIKADHYSKGKPNFTKNQKLASKIFEREKTKKMVCQIEGKDNPCINLTQHGHKDCMSCYKYKKIINGKK